MTSLDYTDEFKFDWQKWLIVIGAFSLFWLLLPHLPVAGTWLATEKAAWFLTRSSGIIAYLLMTGSTLWGLLLSTKLAKKAISPVVSLAMHNYLAWSAIALTLVHAISLLFDSYFTYTLPHLLIPFIGPYSPFWVGLGVIGFYLMMLTSLSFYARKWIGQKNWRRLHYLTFLVYILTTLHGWVAGTDQLLLGAMYIGSSMSVFFLTIYRVLSVKS